MKLCLMGAAVDIGLCRSTEDAVTLEPSVTACSFAYLVQVASPGRDECRGEGCQGLVSDALPIPSMTSFIGTCSSPFSRQVNPTGAKSLIVGYRTGGAGRACANIPSVPTVGDPQSWHSRGPPRTLPQTDVPPPRHREKDSAE